MSSEYITQVLERLQDNPTAQNLDYFVEAHARIGYLAATAEGRAELAEADRKFRYATAFADAKRDGAKTSADADGSATISTHDSKLAELRARETAQKLKNLLSSVEQAINAIKFLGRQDGAQMLLPRR